ncbi:hypothetical protein, partial [Burkholderia mallei]
LHSYIITDAIRDEKVLKFKVDYNTVKAEFKKIETETDEKKITANETKQAFLHPERINAVAQHVLEKFNEKTHR